jgi:hypothetical protein
VILNFAIELVAERNHVLAFAGQELLIRIARIPDSRFRHEIETGAMNDGSAFALTVRSKENGCAEDSLERGNQAPVLRAALLHAERVKHGSGTFERNLRRLLPDRLRGEEDRNEPILAPWQTVAGVPRDLQNEMAVSALVQQTAGWRATDWETAEYKWSRREAEILASRFPLEPHPLD